MNLRPNRFWLIPILIILLCGGLFGFIGIRTVPAGYKGVRTSWGKIVGVADEGFNWCNVFLGEDILLVNLQVQKFESDPQSTASLDLQEVTTTVAVNYRIDKAFVKEVWEELRDEYEARIIRPQLEDSLKAVTVQFTSTEMIQMRPTVRTTLINLLKERLEPFHIIVISVSMTDFQFSSEFNAQLEATATAEKKVLEEQANLKIAELQQQQKVILAKAEAEATILKATGEAEAKIIQAEGEAEAMRLLTEQLMSNPDYLQYLALMQWDGELPIYWGSDAPLPFLEVEEPQ